jgi:thymidylate synthase (FAD)
MKYADEAITVTPIAMTTPIVDFISNGDDLTAYMARVSNPSNQTNFKTADKLLKHCAEEGHWSVFDMVDVIFEIEAPRDISRQVLRHYSMRFQEFSQRYADVTEDMFVLRELRMQDTKNRQNSTPCRRDDWQDEWESDLNKLLYLVQDYQEKWRSRGAAKECVRVMFPEGLTMSRMYAKIPLRTLTHYIKTRGHESTQKEHRLIVEKMLPHIPKLFPLSYKFLLPEETPADAS